MRFHSAAGGKQGHGVRDSRDGGDTSTQFLPHIVKTPTLNSNMRSQDR